jgi:O-6-methylguanine DNA methyltransferase
MIHLTNCWIAETPSVAGTLWVAGDATKITAISWERLDGRSRTGELTWFLVGLEAYLSQKAKIFPGGLGFEGDRPIWSRDPSPYTPYTLWQKVIIAMASIPYGRTKTYGDIARELGNRSFARAVGRICASNPLPVVIPCHRVIAQRALGGYSGGLDKKRFLLSLEGLAT